ncbi:YlaH-like family protein [Salibacterium halotolerans]|uniref:YlaH-like protein n=1 Tax=Salibacterium halotolerans TaxID=1884432 RepID=A0A1I5LZI7_9BACI|nr:YlaH-like family protein [Salibacterium halotolerans]SFP02778.1 YlaH-like protein [Salibacterium halotolerans]
MYAAAASLNEINVTKEQLSWFAGVLNVHEAPITGFWLMYAAVVVMCIIVYNLGFARRLPLLKNAVVYTVMLIGTFPLTIFAFGMPVVESLLAAAAVLGIYKIRLRRYKKEKQENATTS